MHRMSILNVRKSRYQNVYGTCNKQTDWYTNLSKVNKSSAGESSLISANDTFFAVPWQIGGGGALLVCHRNNTPKKIPNNPPIITGHQGFVTDHAFCPFRDDVLATGSVDGTIKIWKLPKDGLKKNMSTSQMTFEGHDKRVNIVNFHPVAQDVLYSCGGIDKLLKFWDLNVQKEKICIEGHTDVIQSVSWNQNGDALVTSCRDRIIRMYDPRTKSILVSGDAHSGKKGFRVCWLQNRDQFFSVGFNDRMQREYFLWDLRKGLKRGPMVTGVIDNLPSQIDLFYMESNQLLFMAGKGDNFIRLYEIDENPPHVHLLTEYRSDMSQTGLALLPQRSVDVYNYEIAKFIKLRGDSNVEMISFIVPRKRRQHERSQSMIFLEDIYSEVPSGEPSLQSNEWFANKNAAPKTISLKKKGMISVYEIAPEDGGKSKPVAKLRGVESQIALEEISGNLILVDANQDDIRHQFTFKTTNDSICFGKERIKFKDIVFVHYTNDIKDSIAPAKQDLWFQILTRQRAYHLIAENAQDRIRWVEGLKRIIKQDSEEIPLGDFFLTCKTEGMVNGWTQNWISLVKDSLLIFQNRKSSIPSLIIPFSEIKYVQPIVRVLGISREEEPMVIDIFIEKSNKRNSFHFYLLCGSDTQKDMWLETLQDLLVQKTGQSTPHELLVLLGMERVKDSKQNIPGKVKAFPIAPIIKEDDLKVLFTAFGKITKIELFRDGKLKDCAIITFENYSSADKAIVLDGITLEGNLLEVTKQDDNESVDPCYIKVDNISTEATKNDLKEMFNVFGDIEHMKVWPDAKGKKYTAYIKYKNAEIGKQVIMLNGSKIQNKEISVSILQGQVNEDALFLNELDPNDVKAGRKHILIQMKGHRDIRSRRVELTPDSMNSEDVFILDTGSKIYQWNGKKASRFKKARGLDVCTNLRIKERGGNAKTVVLDEGVEEDSRDYKEFWKIVGGGKIHKVKEKDGDDIEFEKYCDKNTKLYRLSEIQSKLKIKTIMEGAKPSRKNLKSEYVYVLDCLTEIFIWEGSKASQKLKRMGKKMAMKLEEQSFRPHWTSTTRVIENGETVLFKEKFSDYPSLLPISVSAETPGLTSGANVAATKKQEKILPETLRNYKNRIQEKMFDEGKGEITVWKVEGFEKIEYPKNMYGQFFSGDSFIVLYKYRKENRDCYIIYFWQGKNSSINEKGASALLSVNVFENIRGEALQIRLVQHKETKHFLKIFNGIIVHNGKFSDYKKENDALYDIRSTFKNELASANHSILSITHLNSHHAFVLQTKTTTYIWKGVNANQTEISMARRLANCIKIGNCVEINEGQETNDFWKIMGKKRPKQKQKRYESRLFEFNSATGVVEVEEIFNFAQSDLTSSCVYLLDAVEIMYVWFGNASSFNTKFVGIETSLEYAKKYGKAKVLVVKENQEPIEFQRYFQSWGTLSIRGIEKTDTFLGSISKLLDLEAKSKKLPNLSNLPNIEIINRDDLASKIEQLNSKIKIQSADELYKEYSRTTYSYNELLGDSLPPGLDRTNLEKYLSEDEFLEVFKMDRETFEKLPKFKQQQLKKEVYLF